MYAIVKTGGKQYRVERGQHLLVERLAAEEGQDVTLQPLMYRSDETVLDAEGLAQVQVTARVLAHERGKKLRVVKFKPKRGYKRRTGHRQDLTRIEILDIAHGGKAARKTAKPEAARHEEPQTAKAAAAKPAAAKPAEPKQSEAPKEASEDGA